jgi:hypothetical protein
VVFHPGSACPHILAPRVIGNFKLQVAPTPVGLTPPVFAGLEKAFACTPGPQRPGQTTQFTLSWQAAAGKIPSSQLVYDIYYATVSGHENYAQPNWTSAPGATSFRTPGLASHGSFYFVVRARGRAGGEDTTPSNATASTLASDAAQPRLEAAPAAAGDRATVGADGRVGLRLQG